MLRLRVAGFRVEGLGFIKFRVLGFCSGSRLDKCPTAQDLNRKQIKPQGVGFRGSGFRV